MEKYTFASRRRFVAAASATLLSPLFEGPAYRALGVPIPAESEADRTFPRTPPQQAYAIVAASHFRIDDVRELLQEDQALAKASWDWGFGDWETAIGAASHTGRRDIIRLLMDNGARPTLFTFAALDHVATVRAVCESVPGIQKTRGPHGLTLYRHAANSKSTKVLEYLESLGGSNENQPGRSISGDEAAPYLGTYHFGPGRSDRLEVLVGKTVPGIGIRRVGGIARFMAMIEPHVFNIYGAQHVRIEFRMGDGKAQALSIGRGSFRLDAERL